MSTHQTMWQLCEAARKFAIGDAISEMEALELALSAFPNNPLWQKLMSQATARDLVGFMLGALSSTVSNTISEHMNITPQEAACGLTLMMVVMEQTAPKDFSPDNRKRIVSLGDKLNRIAQGGEVAKS